MATTKDVARAFSIDEQTVRRYARDGVIPFSETLGGHRRYDLDEVRVALARARTERFAPVAPVAEETPRLADSSGAGPILRRYRGRRITRATIAEAQAGETQSRTIPFIGVRGSSRFVIGQGAGAR
jgi:hypothetical protein